MAPKNQQEHPASQDAPKDSEEREESPSKSYHPLRPASPPTRSIRRRIRVRKEDSAFVYNILESYEGITAYSTLEHSTGDLHRDLELLIPPDFHGEVDELLKRLGDLVYELEPNKE